MHVKTSSDVMSFDQSSPRSPKQAVHYVQPTPACNSLRIQLCRVLQGTLAMVTHLQLRNQHRQVTTPWVHPHQSYAQHSRASSSIEEEGEEL